MRRILTLLTLFVLMVVAAGPTVAQAPPAKSPAKPAKPPKPAEESLQAWNAMAKKIIEMAEDFPEDKYDYRPTPEVRSFAQIILHIGAVNYFFTNAAAGREAGKAEDDPPRANFKTKAYIVAYITKSFADGAAVIQQKGERGMAQHVKHPFGNRQASLNGVCRDLVEHSAEHYGNLVVYYRLNALVPPASRPRR